MKQHIKTLGLLLVSLLALAACKVEYIPEGNKAQTAFQTMQDVKWTREAMFETVRSAEAPGNLIVGDYQSDLYSLIALVDNGSYGPFYDWDPTLLINADMIEGYYGSFCSLIKDANYFIMRAEELKANEDLIKNFTEDDMNKLNIYIAEARTLRALGHYRLMIHFSKRYNDANDGGDLGIVMAKTYDPLFRNTKKARSTQKEVYEWCLKELEEAANVLPTKSAYNDIKMDGIPCYLVDDYAHALRARILLEMHRYQDAIAEVEDLIDRYPLTDKLEDFSKIWREETSPEIMIKTYANQKIGRIGGILHGIQYSPEYDAEIVIPLWLPTQYFVDLYTKPIDTQTSPGESDYRLRNWLEKSSKKGPNDVEVLLHPQIGSNKVMFVSKFRGNPALDKNRDKHLFSYAHTTHLFDIAEAWLIKAEAEAWSGDVAGAKATLEEFRIHRGLGDPLSANTQEEIKKTVMNERTREMIGMGTRMVDLKRWQVDLDRSDKGPQEGVNPGALHIDNMDLHKSHTDKMFIWEFPLQDRFANKELVANW